MSAPATMPLPAAFAADAARLGAPLDARALERLAVLGGELIRWNRSINLTAVDDPARVATHHLLDSLSALPLVAGLRCADVGTGAGFPGLPLAIAAADAEPGRRWTLIDSAGKKLRFIAHVARLLGLDNVEVRHARVESLHQEAPYDTVITRAFAPLPRLCAQVRPLCGAGTRVVAMKGRWPPPDDDEKAPLPEGWRIEEVRPVEVPGLGAARHLLRLAWTPPPPA